MVQNIEKKIGYCLFVIAIDLHLSLYFHVTHTFAVKHGCNQLSCNRINCNHCSVQSKLN